MDNPAKPLGRFALAAVLVIAAALVLYIGAVLHIYVIGWIIGLIQSIF